MARVSLAVDFNGISMEDSDKVRDVRDIVKTVIENIILVWARENKGMNEKERRQYYRIINKMEDAISANNNEVEIEDSAFSFMRKCFRESKLMPNKVLQRVETSLFGEE